MCQMAVLPFRVIGCRNGPAETLKKFNKVSHLRRKNPIPL